LKRNVEPNIRHHSDDVCDGEEIEAETQGKSEYVFTEENIGGNNNDADESEHSDDDIDDFLVLSTRRL
jgi:hypothetical protein